MAGPCRWVDHCSPQFVNVCYKETAAQHLTGSARTGLRDTRNFPDFRNRVRSRSHPNHPLSVHCCLLNRLQPRFGTPSTLLRHPLDQFRLPLTRHWHVRPNCHHHAFSGTPPPALWQNENRDGDTYYTVNLAKVYEDRHGKLPETSSFSDIEILRVAELGKEARTHALHLKREQTIERHQRQAHDHEQGSGRSRRFRNRAEPGLEC